MVDKINIEIDLEGGAEVERQLADIGKAGQQAFGDIQSAADEIDFSSAADQLQSVQQAVKSAAALEQVVQVFKRVEGAFDALGNAASKFGARLTRSLGPIGVFARALGPLGIALGVAGGALIKFGDDAADALNGLAVAAAKLDKTPQQLNQLQKALTGLGISGDAIGPGLQKLKETLDQEFFPVDVTTGFQRVIAQLERMPDSVQRTQLAIAKLGDALGGQVIAGLQSGTLSAQNFQTALAGIPPLTQAQIVAAGQYQIALNQLIAAWAQFKTEIVTPLATPVFQFLTEQLKIFQGNIKSFISDIQAIWSALQAIDQFTFSTLSAAFDAVASAASNLFSSLTGFSFSALVDAWTTSARQFGDAAVASWNQIVSVVQAAITAISNFISSLSGITWDAIASAGVAAWDQITGAIQRAIDAVLKFIGLKPSAPATGGGAQGKAHGGLIGGSGSGTSDSNLAWLSRGEHVMPAHVVRQPGVLGFLEAMRRSGGIPGYQGGGEVDFGASGTPQGFRGARTQARGISPLADQISEWIDKILAATGTVISATRAAAIELARVTQSIENIGLSLSDRLLPVLREMTNAVNNLRGVKGAARGGLLGGRGTGTSDSNLAWVSRGEYITPARAVAQPGVLAFLEALRRSGGNLSAVLDDMGRFALGGLVPRMAYAGGGAVGSMSHVTINFPGTPPISGLRASAEVVDQLQRAAALAQVRSGGRKPSRYS